MALIINVAFDEMKDDSVNKMLKAAYRKNKNRSKPLHKRSEPDPLMDDDAEDRDNPADLDDNLNASKPPKLTTADMPNSVAAQMTKRDLKPRSKTKKK